jgi:5-hydroxyisourate hydrolase
MTLSTHVLDTARGSPAAGVPVLVQRRGDEGWTTVVSGRTDADGRLSGVPTGAAGRYRIVFDTAAYVASFSGQEAFFPEVTVMFAVADPGAHHHVPLLLSPFGYSTYRGS